MELLTTKLKERFAEIGCQAKKGNNAIVIAHYFIGGCEWWFTEYYPDENIFFGFVNLNDSQMAELGYTSLEEMKSFNIRGLEIERDLHWKFIKGEGEDLIEKRIGIK
ncbi:MAG: hypothetical protein A2086_01725 [Spirochaetes bacterium GWD1_27_9]|nr:MAG: hypothetical protein A2Z98_04005 [Spirochaetes bacterium GWB1_27_13]OHD20611.1 MAG: hypothetical protein A2Y34_17485 [Spirochaetes bacterium GWC1_27_15]OHD41822.1 MAG: hypothetical protein A2086_01725 [Spirochaetes bacterium GWD1_27_9]